MFSLENTDFNLVVKENAADVIKADRMRFVEVYRTTEEYCKTNEVIISDVNRVILGKESGAEFSDKYNLYCKFPYKHAVNLANIIHSNVGEWVKMRTIVGRREFVIDYDGRPLINIFNIDIQPNAKMNDLVMPIRIGDLNYMSPELEIIDVYHKLYSPDESENWESLAATERQLYDLLLHRVKNGIFGGAESKAEPKRDITDLQYLKYLVLNEFCAEFIKDYVVVGHWALHAVEASRDEEFAMKSSIEKLQVITSIDIGKAVEDVINFLSTYTNAKVVSRIQNLHIPKDFRISRHTIYIGVPSKNGEIKEKAFMDIFNCGNFELIPYISISLKTKYGDMVKYSGERPFERSFEKSFEKSSWKNRSKGLSKDHSPRHHHNRKFRKHRRGGAESSEFVIKIGNPFVLLRFLIIDLWIIRMIHGMGHFTDDMLKLKTKYIMYVVEKIKTPEFGLLDKVFGIDYVGVYKDYDISKKIENLKSDPFFPYYPERELTNSGKYKNIS